MSLSLPRLLLHLEGLVALSLATLAYRALAGSWGRFGLLFLAPDLAMLGYLVSPRVGSWIYNAFHTYAGPGLLWLGGPVLTWPDAGLLALIWTAHIGFDRLLGYGLKYPTRFQDTHLQRL